MSDIELTDEEERAIASLKRVAKKWPDSLWLYAADGRLNVMRKDDDGNHALECDGIDPEYAVDEIDIDSDGGDW